MRKPKYKESGPVSLMEGPCWTSSEEWYLNRAQLKYRARTILGRAAWTCVYESKKRKGNVLWRVIFGWGFSSLLSKSSSLQSGGQWHSFGEWESWVIFSLLASPGFHCCLPEFPCSHPALQQQSTWSEAALPFLLDQLIPLLSPLPPSGLEQEPFNCSRLKKKN